MSHFLRGAAALCLLLQAFLSAPQAAADQASDSQAVPAPDLSPPPATYTRSLVNNAQAARTPLLSPPDPILATAQDINPDVSTNSDADATTGGRVNHLASVPGNNSIFYAASEQGGLFKTTNTAAQWMHLDGHVPQITWDVKVDPSNTQRVYATSFYDGKVNSLAGIEVSTDGGATWTHPASATPGGAANCSSVAKAEPSAFGISIRPDASQNVFIGTNCGVARSTDSGATWIFLDPTPATVDANNVWAVLAQSATAANPQGIVNICGDDGFFSSTDSGNTWTAGAGFPSGRCSLAVSPDERYVLFAAASDNNIYESDNAGANWTSLGTPDPTPQGRIPFVVTNKRTSNFDLWFGDVSLWRGGCTTPTPAAVGGAARCPTGFFARQAGPPFPPNPAGWSGGFTRSVGGHDDLGDLVFDTTVSPDSCPRVFSSDGGAHVNQTTASPGCQSPTWQRSNVGLHALWIWTMSGTPEAANLGIFFGVQDDGSQATTTARNTPPTWINPQCCDVFDTVSDTNRVLITECCFTGAQSTQLRIGDGNGNNFNQINTYPPGTLSLPGNRSFRSTRRLVQFASQQYALITSSGVFFTTDVTASPVVWTQLGTGTPASPCGLQVGVASGTPTFVLQAGNCTGSSVDQIFTHAGASSMGNWQRIDNNGGLTGGFGIIAVDPADPTRLYGSNLTPAGPQMVFSNDGGTTWTRDTLLDSFMTGNGAFRYVTQSGPTNFTGFNGYAQPTLVAFDGQDPNLLAAGGHDSGVFLSGDRGNSWALITDPFTPATSGAPHLSQPRSAFFDHPTGQPTALYIGTQGRGVWRLTAKLTTLTYNGDTTADFNDKATLAASLMDASVSPPVPIAGAALTFQLGSQSCPATTDGSGHGSCSITVNQVPGAYTVIASFAGDNQHIASTTAKPFTITKEDTALTYTGATTGHFNDAITVSARLVDPANAAEGESTPNPIVGKAVTFSLNGTESCTGTTDATGVASCAITPKEAAGTYTLNAHFASDAFYQAADVNAPFVVTLEDTNLSSQTSLQVFIVGATATLSSTLVDSANAAEGEASDVPIANPVSSDTGPVPTNVTMTLGSGAGSQSCTAPTNASGVATCSFTVSSSVGNGFLTITDSFTDSTNHFASATNTQQALVAAFPDHGSFEIGDVTEDNASPTGALVNWWGPSHWKTSNNSYSALPAGQTTEPSQMKGFIETPASFPPTCGTAWTSDPGDSSNPPATVPAYMATIVASTVGVNPDGSVITGNSVEIVVIQTNLPSDTYAPSVGGAGTGPIVAEACPSNGPPK